MWSQSINLCFSQVVTLTKVFNSRRPPCSRKAVSYAGTTPGRRAAQRRTLQPAFRTKWMRSTNTVTTRRSSVARRVTRRMGTSLSWFWRTLRLVNALSAQASSGNERSESSSRARCSAAAARCATPDRSCSQVRLRGAPRPQAMRKRWSGIIRLHVSEGGRIDPRGLGTQLFCAASPNRVIKINAASPNQFFYNTKVDGEDNGPQRDGALINTLTTPGRSSERCGGWRCVCCARSTCVGTWRKAGKTAS